MFTCSASFSWANNISCGYVLQLVSKPMITDLDQRNRWEEEERERESSRLGDTLAWISPLLNDTAYVYRAIVNAGSLS